MGTKTGFILETRKLRCQHVPLLFLMIFALVTAWTYWYMDDLGTTRLNDVSAILFTNLLLMSAILCPIVLTALASRMCDTERMGNTYKWICIMQKPEHACRGRVATGSLCIIPFALIQTLPFRAVSRSYGEGAASHLTGYFITICLTSLCVFIPQLGLSLKFTNQLTSIFIDIKGTFTRLFSWLLNRWSLYCLTPWGYYTSLCNVGCTYDRSVRYTAYSWDTYPFFWMTILVAATMILHRYGRKYLLETVCEAM